MFTGIVEEIGTVVRVAPNRIEIHAPIVTTDTRIGESIAVQGVCLTVVSCAGGGFTADLMGETRRRTTLGGIKVGARVNLERAVRADGRLGGHIVQGHVDGVAAVVDRSPGAAFDLLGFSVDTWLTRYIVAKGSIAVDGVSLTVVDATEDGFTIGLIPGTRRMTTLGNLVTGSRCNIEVDVMAKQLERLVLARADARDSRDPTAWREEIGRRFDAPSTGELAL